MKVINKSSIIFIILCLLCTKESYAFSSLPRRLREDHSTASLTSSKVTIHRRHCSKCFSSSNVVNDQCNSSSETEIIEDDSLNIYTSAVLCISYDGAHFFGWSAGNDGQPLSTSSHDEDDKEEYFSQSNGAPFLKPLVHQGRRSRKRKGTVIRDINTVRSVEGAIQKILAKIYGNVPKDRIVVEGSSRTDKGVHAHGMMALIYCLKKDEDCLENNIETEHQVQQSSSIISQKKKPHPSSPYDTSSFEPLPFNSDLSKLMFVLNRMLPPDVRVMAVSPTPSNNNKQQKHPFFFHPSCHAIGKTYQYTFSVGNMHDPLRWRHVWHVQESNKKGASVSFDVEQAEKVANLFVGTHDFSAFRGAFKSKSEKLKKASQDTICTIENLRLENEESISVPTLDSIVSPISNFSVGQRKDENGVATTKNDTYIISIKGDRFLYKMVRFMVGTIVAAGIGRVSVEDVELALENKSWSTPPDELENGNDAYYKNKNIFCAPSHGLVLTEVFYPNEVKFKWEYG